MTLKRKTALVYSLASVLGVFGLVGMLDALSPNTFGTAKAASFVDDESVLDAATTRRLTSDQYKRTIEDVFGSTISLGGRFEPELRVDGLHEVGAALVSVSPTGMEQYDAMARTIAEQVVDEKHRDLLLPCKPQSVQEPDDACVSEFVSKVGRFLFRRPLTEGEHLAYVAAARDATQTLNDFYKGLSLSLGAMLSSPQFLFRHETLERDPEVPGAYRLDSYSRASRLSFFLWNAGPDLALLEAAEKGELYSDDGVRRQVERMLASPRAREGVRAFFADMLHFDDLETLT
ncbi:MAG: DUF1592 domain-containing protein, partial [Rhodospirillaceae bacterium]